MAEKSDLCLLGLIILCSLLTGISGVEDHVFITSGENVRLPCNNALSDCKSTTWIYYNSFGYSTSVELITLGIKKKDTERHERLSLESDCSLNIKNVTGEDSGFYTCQKYVNGQKQGPDARVYLNVLHVSSSSSPSSSSSSSSSSQTEISPGRSVTLSCQLYSILSCDYWVSYEGLELLWVNQAGVDLKTDSRYQILSSSDQYRCSITLTTTLLNEDDNREWRCQLAQRNQLKTSVRYTVKYSAQASTTAVNPVHITHSQDPSTTNTYVSKVIVSIVEIAVFAAPTVILLQIICARRAVLPPSLHLYLALTPSLPPSLHLYLALTPSLPPFVPPSLHLYLALTPSLPPVLPPSLHLYLALTPSLPPSLHLYLALTPSLPPSLHLYLALTSSLPSVLPSSPPLPGLDLQPTSSPATQSPPLPGLDPQPTTQSPPLPGLDPQPTSSPATQSPPLPGLDPQPTSSPATQSPPLPSLAPHPT
ncbi:unnamed protein product [Leuciscus chuanchicus]